MNYIALVFLTILVFFSKIVKAQDSVVWVPIHVGSVITFIPSGSPSKLPAPGQLTVLSDGSVKTLNWGGVEQAKEYEVQGLTASGEWATILVTDDTTVAFDSRFDGYLSVRVTACNDYGCSSTGLWSNILSITKKVIFIHTDLLGSPVVETDENGNLL